MRSRMEQGILVVIATVLLFWGAYHIFRYTEDVVEVETVFQDTVPRSLSGRGIAIRKEQVLEKTSNGTPRFIYKDGTRIGTGQPIVEYYSGDVDTASIRRIRRIEEEIGLLQEAQNKNINNFASAPTISRDIREQFATLTHTSTTGRCSDLTDLRYDLELLVNRRQIATSKSDSFENQISLLKKEQEELRKKSNLNNIPQGITPTSGYFAQKSDGYEQRLHPEMMGDLKIDDYMSLVSEDAAVTVAKGAGRMITSSKWYFAVTMPSYQTEWLQVGQRTKIHIDGSLQEIPARVSEILLENNNDFAVVVLYSDAITEEILNLRTADVTLSFSQFTGLRINSSNIRFRENEEGIKERGVFVLKSNVVHFKKIDPIYEESSFILSRMNYADSGDNSVVSLFDQIVIGADLHDGKIIQ